VLHLAMMGSLFWGYFDAFTYTTDRSLQAVDFFGVYEAAQRAFEGDLIFQSAPFPQDTPYFSPFRYVPIFAYAAAAPAMLMDPWDAYWGMVALNELIVVLCAYFTWREGGRGSWAIVGAAMWFAFVPLYVEQYMGQFSVLMAALLLWIAIALLRERELLAAVPWSVSLIVKTSSALIGPVFVRNRWWGALILGGAVLLLLNAPYFLWRPDEFDAFMQENIIGRAVNFRWNLYWPGDHGLLSLFETAILSTDSTAKEPPGILSNALTFAVLAPSLAITFFARKADSLLLFAIWSCTLFLFYDWIAEFHYVMLLPVLAMLVAARADLRVAALIVFVLLALPTPYWLIMQTATDGGDAPQIIDKLQEDWPAWSAMIYHGAKPVPVLLFWCYLIWVQAKEGLGFDWFRSVAAAFGAALPRSSTRTGAERLP
jgi:hypothetical protein